jgi:hypothetical protein
MPGNGSPAGWQAERSEAREVVKLLRAAIGIVARTMLATRSLAHV